MQTIFLMLFPQSHVESFVNLFWYVCFEIFVIVYISNRDRDANSPHVQRDQQLTTLLNIPGARWTQGFWLFIRQRVEMADVCVLPNQGSVWLGAISLIRSFYETGMVACRGSIFGTFFILYLPPPSLFQHQKILLAH